MTYRLRHETWIPGTLAEVFEFFSKAENLGRITPAMLHFRIHGEAPTEMRAGTQIDYTIRIHGLPVRWKTVIEKWDPPREFSDVQARGPYKLWHHTHRFREKDGGVAMEDEVEYALPMGPFGRVAHWLFVRRDVEGIFEYREQKIREIFGTKEVA